MEDERAPDTVECAAMPSSSPFGGMMGDIYIWLLSTAGSLVTRGTPDDVERLRKALDMPSQMPPPLDDDELRTPIPTVPRSGARRDSDIVAPGFPRVSLGGLSDGLRPSSLPSLPSGGGGTGGSGSYRLHETFTQSLDPVTGSALMRTLDAKAHAVLALIVEQLSASNTDEVRISSIARGLGRNHAARLFHSVLALSQVRLRRRQSTWCALIGGHRLI